jgi:hypothetical protein
MLALCQMLLNELSNEILLLEPLGHFNNRDCIGRFQPKIVVAIQCLKRCGVQFRMETSITPILKQG